MNLPIDFTFEYERPNISRRGRMRTPAQIYIPEKQQTGGILFIAKEFVHNNGLNDNEIALQVKGQMDTYIIFNPPKNAPRFFKRTTTPKKGTVSYSCTESVRKMIDIFCPGQHDHELWLERVGTFKDSVVFRLRNLQETDTLYRF